MCFTSESIVTMTISYLFSLLSFFAKFVLEVEFLAVDQRNPTTDSEDLGLIDQID